MNEPWLDPNVRYRESIKARGGIPDDGSPKDSLADRLDRHYRNGEGDWATLCLAARDAINDLLALLTSKQMELDGVIATANTAFDQRDAARAAKERAEAENGRAWLMANEALEAKEQAEAAADEGEELHLAALERAILAEADADRLAAEVPPWKLAVLLLHDKAVAQR